MPLVRSFTTCSFYMCKCSTQILFDKALFVLNTNSMTFSTKQALVPRHLSWGVPHGATKSSRGLHSIFREGSRDFSCMGALVHNSYLSHARGRRGEKLQNEFYILRSVNKAGKYFHFLPLK